MNNDTDWQGRPIPADEHWDDEILIWEVTPHPTRCDCDCMWERSWQRMLRAVTNELECMLERPETEELIDEPFAVTFQLRKTTVREWHEVAASED